MKLINQYIIAQNSLLVKLYNATPAQGGQAALSGAGRVPPLLYIV